MAFLLPIGLFALLLLPLIVLLHIIRERRRRQMVPSLLHWRDLPRPKMGRRLNRLPLSWLLLLQLLVAALLALAIARPRMFGGPLVQATQTIVVLDTSTSMEARDGGATRFDTARSRAQEYVRGLVAGRSVTLIATSPTPHVIGTGSAGEQAALEAALLEVRPGGTANNLETALALAESSLDARQPGQIIVLTDGTATPPANRTTVAPVEWQQIGGDADNRAVIAFAARPGGGRTQVYARVANYAAGNYTGVLRLYADDNLIDARPLQIAGNAEAEQTWTLPAGSQQLRVALDSGDALAADDQAFLSLDTTRPLTLVLVSSTPEPMQRALGVIPGAEVRVVAPANYTPATEADVTVFENTLPSSWPEGAVLAIDPPAASSLITVTTSRTIDDQAVVAQSALLGGLGFGGVRFGSIQQIEPLPGSSTLLAAGDLPLITRARLGAHEIAVWGFSLNNSNFTNRLAFPLLVSRTIRDLAPTGLPASLQSGSTFTLAPDPRSTTIELVAPDGDVRQFTSGAAVALDRFEQAGWYTVIERGANGERFRGQLAVNAGSPLESNLRQISAPVFQANTTPVAASLARQATDLWPWLALLALLALGGEWAFVHVRRAT